MIKSIIQDFLNKELGKLIKNDYIYNEFSLQHELGIYLRKKLKKQGKYKVQFERNVDDVFGSLSSEKKEMDIYIVKYKNKEKEHEYAIELKFPKNGQHQVEMYQFVRDICFMEQVKDAGVKTFVLTLVDDHLFYTDTGKTGKVIYDYFRKSKTIKSKINKPTKCEGSSFVEIAGEYTIRGKDWHNVLHKESRVVNPSKEEYRYYFLEMNN